MVGWLCLMPCQQLRLYHRDCEHETDADAKWDHLLRFKENSTDRKSGFSAKMPEMGSVTEV